VLLYTRGSSISHYPLAVKLHEVGCTVNYFMHGISSLSSFTPLLYHSRLHTYYFRRAILVDLLTIQAALRLQDDKPYVRAFRQFLRDKVSAPSAISYAGGSKRAYVALR
jgi:hypothetical protein